MPETPATLMYIGDPMCSWCWGFAPVLQRIQKEYEGRLVIEPIVGGLRPWTDEPLEEEFRKTILHHWREVHEASGQPFCFDFEMGENFMYDTEPGCRAVVTMRELKPEWTLPYFHSLHRAFYADNMDITKAELLATEAETFGIDRSEFLELFEQDDIKRLTVNDFKRSRSMGVTAYPAVVVQMEGELKLLTYGFMSFEEIQPRVDAWLTSVE